MNFRSAPVNASNSEETCVAMMPEMPRRYSNTRLDMSLRSYVLLLGKVYIVTD